MENNERASKIKDQAPLIAAVITNAIYTAELLNVQRGGKLTREQVIQEVIGLHGQLITALMGE